MADLSANFSADFGKFTAACEKAVISLKSIEEGAGGVTTRLDRMANSLTGTKLIQQASIMAEAVQRVGGVSTLTARELQRVGGTAEEAAEKLRKLGQEVPPGIQKIADAAIAARAELAKTGQTGATAFDGLMGSVKNLAGAFGLAFGATAVVGGIKNLIGSALKMASAIDDSSKKLGVSAEKFQGWVAAAELAGGSAEDISTAVGKMNANLDQASKQTVGALKDLGLQFQTVRNMKPEEAFETIVTAIMKVPDPMERARLAVELFGKGGQALLPAIADDMVKVGNAAQKMSDETVRQLDAAGDAWKKLGNSVTIITGSIIASVISTVNQTSSSWAELGKFVTQAAAGGVAYALDQQAVRKAIQETQAAVVTYGPTLEQLTGKIHKTAEELAAEEAALKKSQAAWEAHRQAIQAVADTLTGRKVAQEVKDLQEALALAQKQGGLTAEGWRIIDDRIKRLVTDGAPLTRELRDIWAANVSLNDIVKQVDHSLANLAKTWPTVTVGFTQTQLQAQQLKLGLAGIVPIVEGLPKGLTQLGKVDLAKPVKDVESLHRALSDLSQAFAQMAQIGGDSFGGILKGVGMAVAGINTAQTALENISKVSKSAGGAFGTPANAASTIASYATLAATIYQVWSAFDAYYKKQQQITTLEHDASQVAYDFGQGFSRASEKVGASVRATLEEIIRMNGGIKQAADIQKFYLEAEALHLSDVIQDLGGITAQTMPAVLTHFKALFDLVKQGGTLTGQALQELNQVLPQILAASTDAVGLWDDAFQQVIADAGDIDQINKLLREQSSIGATSIGTAAKITADAYAQQAKDLTTLSGLHAQLAGASEEGQKSIQAEIDKTNADLVIQQGIIQATGITSQAQADAMASAIEGGIAAAMAGGQSFVQAVLGQKDAVNALATDMEKAGFAGGAAWDFIKGQVDLATDAIAGPALQALEANTAGIVALSNAGQLSAGQFAALEERIGATATALEAQGQSSDQVMAAMQGDLQVAWELENKYGIKLDETTQKLVDQAVEAGTVGEAHKSANDQMIDGINRLVDHLDLLLKKFGVDIPASMQGTARAAQTAAGDTQRAWDGLDIQVPIDFHYRTTGEPPDLTGAATIGGPGGPEAPSFAREGFVSKPTLAKVGDYPGGEYILHKATVDRLLAAASSGQPSILLAPSARSSSSAPSLTVNVNVEGNVLGNRQALQDFGRELLQHIATNSKLYNLTRP